MEMEKKMAMKKGSSKMLNIGLKVTMQQVNNMVVYSGVDPKFN